MVSSLCSEKEKKKGKKIFDLWMVILKNNY